MKYGSSYGIVHLEIRVTGASKTPKPGQGPENKTQYLEVPLEVSSIVDSRSTGSFLEGIICVTNVEGAWINKLTKPSPTDDRLCKMLM